MVVIELGRLVVPRIMFTVVEAAVEGRAPARP
jgi:hypothetical protein